MSYFVRTHTYYRRWAHHAQVVDADTYDVVAVCNHVHRSERAARACGAAMLRDLDALRERADDASCSRCGHRGVLMNLLDRTSMCDVCDSLDRAKEALSR